MFVFLIFLCPLTWGKIKTEQTNAKLRAIDEKYVELKKKLQLEHPKDLPALQAKQAQERQKLEQEHADLPRRFGSSIVWFSEDENENENTEFARLRATQEKERKDLWKKHEAEKQQYKAQTDKMRDTEQLLWEKIRTVLTVSVAEALQASNPSAVKGFLELFLQYGREDQDEMVSLLAEKIGGITFLDLSAANYRTFASALGQDPQFLQLFTSPATLSTLVDVRIFGVLLGTSIQLSQPGQEYQDRELREFSVEHRKLFETETYRIVFRNVVEKIQKEQTDFATNCVNLLDIINSEAGVTSQTIHHFFLKSENMEFGKTFEEEMQKEESVPGVIEKARQLAAEKFSEALAPNQQIWQQLLQLLNTAKAREEAFLAQQRANKQLSAKAFERVVIEMKRRFDATVPTSAENDFSFERTEKQELAAIAKRMWAPDYWAEERQAQMREMSPEAAQVLEEMAR